MPPGAASARRTARIELLSHDLRTSRPRPTEQQFQARKVQIIKTTGLEHSKIRSFEFVSDLDIRISDLTQNGTGGEKT